MAKAAGQTDTDAQSRKRGEQIGLDTLVVHAVNDGDQETERSVAEANARVPRLGTTFARIKLKGIDGCPHKQWSMRFNSWLHEEPYQGSTCRQRPERSGDSYAEQRWCMAVVSSCREMLGQVLQRAQPLLSVAIIQLGTLTGPPALSRRKAGMTSSHHAPYALGHTHATMAGTMGSDPAMGSGSLKAGLSTD